MFPNGLQLGFSSKFGSYTLIVYHVYTYIGKLYLPIASNTRWQCIEVGGNIHELLF